MRPRNYWLFKLLDALMVCCVSTIALFAVTIFVIH